MQDTVPSVFVRHTAAQETPLPTCIGLMLHAHICKKELLDRLYYLGMSISYDCVLSFSAALESSICKQFQREKVVCPPKSCSNVFTTAAVDHNPNLTMSKESFHQTGISVIWHPSFDSVGVDCNIVVVGEPRSSKSVDNLTHFYTDVTPIAESVKTYQYQLCHYNIYE